MQTEGRKRWRLYKNQVELLRIHTGKVLDPSTIGEPILDLTLYPGDFLYMPRGVVHQAWTEAGVFSTHTTFSVYHRLSWADFISSAASSLVDRAAEAVPGNPSAGKQFRKGLPLHHLSFMGTPSMHGAQYLQEDARKTAFQRQFVHLLRELANDIEKDGAGLDLAMDAFALDFVTSRLPPPPSPRAPLPFLQKRDGHVGDDSEGYNIVVSEEDLHDNSMLRFRMKDPRYIRLFEDEDEDEEENLVKIVRLRHSFYNSRRHHLAGKGSEEGQNDFETEAAQKATKRRISMKAETKVATRSFRNAQYSNDLALPLEFYQL